MVGEHMERENKEQKKKKQPSLLFCRECARRVHAHTAHPHTHGASSVTSVRTPPLILGSAAVWGGGSTYDPVPTPADSLAHNTPNGRRRLPQTRLVAGGWLVRGPAPLAAQHSAGRRRARDRRVLHWPCIGAARGAPRRAGAGDSVWPVGGRAAASSGRHWRRAVSKFFAGPRRRAGARARAVEGGERERTRGRRSRG